MKKKLGILGANGLLGNDLVSHLSSTYKVIPITRENYKEYKGSKFDIFINANGNSRRYWANQNPQEDFFASTVTVAKSIFDFSSDVYIYISSPDVYENHAEPLYTQEEEIIEAQKLAPYGLHKYLGELIVKKYKEKFLILRSAMILGSKIKKGPLYDILNDNPIFVSLDTKLQVITTQAIYEIIEALLTNSIICETFNIGGIGTVDFTKIHTYFNKEILVSSKAETQNYEMSVEKIKRYYPDLKTSAEYLRNFLYNYQKMQIDYH